MRRKVALATLVTLFCIPVSASAKIDPTSCPKTPGRYPSATSVIHGIVENAEGMKLGGLKVELYSTYSSDPKESTTTSTAPALLGQYTICAGDSSGTYYDTFDVHAGDPSLHPLYATAAQPYSTYINPASDADFTPASGHPLLYMTSLTVSPNAISNAIAPSPGNVTVAFTIRSKAPADTAFSLTLTHPVLAPYHGTVNRVIAVSGVPTIVDGGPAAGGWNQWTYSELVYKGTDERTFWAKVQGFRSGVEVTQRDEQPYVVDDTPIVFGKADTTVCGNGNNANGLSPVSPPGTTNHQPIVTQEVCDPKSVSDATFSGPDPVSLKGWLCTSALADVSTCTTITPFLNARVIVWESPTVLTTADRWIVFQIADAAGNVTRSPHELLSIVDRGGQPPTFTALSPGNLGQGSTGGVVVGSSLTTPSSIPVIGFRVRDADGQTDLQPGTLDVRVYYADNNGSLPTLVYRYDISMDKDAYDAVTHAGGGDFDLSSGLFKASGYALQEKPPGRYVVTASVTDHGGNNASVTWHFFLLLAV
ncbi:MAG: hypothetical protein ABR552_08715 [Actinomycetota bacterium]